MWIIPVDLASVSDWVAVAAVQTTEAVPRRYDVPHLDRWRESYPETVRRVAELANRPPLRDAVLVVDATGVGRPVVDLLRTALPGRVVYAITITGGSNVTAGQGPRDVRVPKKDLVGAAQVLLSTSRLRVARELEHTDTLIRELATFQVKITAAMNETFESGREGVNDDLVLALAMGAWLGEHLPVPLADVRALVPEWGTDDTEADEPLTPAQALAADLPHLFAGE